MKKLFENWNSWVISESSNMSAVVNGGRIDLYHYSKAKQPELVLDPGRFASGRNSWSKREYNISSVPRVFFYADNDKTESFIDQGISAPYEVSVAASDIYDLVSDPEGLLSKSISQYATTPDMHKVLQSLAGIDVPGEYDRGTHKPLRGRMQKSSGSLTKLIELLSRTQMS